MPPFRQNERQASIRFWADDLNRLAQNLEKDYVAWAPIDRCKDQPFNAEWMLSKAKADVLWRNAVEAGTIIFELCGLGAFDERPRIRNLICQVRAELETCLKEFKVPFSYHVVNVPYNVGRTDRSFDVYFVKVFEKFCSVWITCQDDRRKAEMHYDCLKEKAELHAKVLNELSGFLKTPLSSR